MATSWRTQNNFYRKYLRNMMQLYRSRPDVRIFTEVILSLVAVSIFGVFAIRPTLVTIASLIQEIQSKEEIVAQLDQKVQNLSRAQEVYQQNVSQIALIETSIPNQPKPQLSLRQLEAIVAKNSVSLSSITIEDVVLKGENVGTATFRSDNIVVAPFPTGAEETKFSFNLAGSYTNISSFLKDLDNLRMIVVTDKGSLSGGEQGNNITLTISGRIPYIK